MIGFHLILGFHNEILFELLALCPLFYLILRWVGIWMEFIGDTIILLTAVLLVVQRDSIDPGIVGLALSFAMQVSEMTSIKL